MGGDVKDKGPPEQLVLGAKLKCWYGSVCSYLIVLDFNRQLKDGLPMACVSDSKVNLNITPFGRCLNGGPCECLIGLSDEWTNPEPQNEDINGKQIITTHSFIVCDKQGGMFIEPQDSGQDGVFAEQIVFLSQMEHDYPGLLAFLMDPNASVYLTDGMLDKALSFLGDCITRQGDSIWLAGLDPVNNLVDPYILAALSHVTFANVSDVSDRLTGMENEITKAGLNNSAGSQFLDLALLDVIRKNTSEHALKVEGGGFYKWQEEHKALISFVGDSMMSMAYAMVIWGSAQGYAARQGTNYSMESDIRDAEIGQNNRFNSFNGKTTEGRLITPDGQQIPFTSGGPSPYRNVSATHAEGKAAVHMRENGISDATLYHNNTNGTCNYCDKGLPTLLPEGSTLTVFPPANAVAPNKYWIDIPKTYTGNTNIPSTR